MNRSIMSGKSKHSSCGQAMVVRPYQILCVACALGGNRVVARRKAIVSLMKAVRRVPDRPLTLACNAGDVYQYQDPGTAADWPRGIEFNRKRDLDILSFLNWPPGITLPARTIFSYMLNKISSVTNFCGHVDVGSAAWRGCPYANAGFYEQARQAMKPNDKSAVFQMLVPKRAQKIMECEKCASMKAMQRARVICIRPHLLMCSVCQYARGVRPPYKPDNLPELLQILITSKNDRKIKLVAHADWMMCAPCHMRVPELNACVNSYGSGGLANEKRDLDVLCRLGLRYGSVMSGRALYRRLFQKIPDVEQICRRDPESHPDSAWWDGCFTANYVKGRRELRRLLRC